jgi:succinyl-diaminopimelate desuccinylase
MHFVKKTQFGSLCSSLSIYLFVLDFKLVAMLLPNDIPRLIKMRRLHIITEQKDESILEKTNEILLLAKRFIAIQSTEENADARAKVLELALSELEGYTIERFESNGFKSILVYRAQERPEKFKIILNGHLDVVPGKDARYTPEVDGDKLYGVGSLDMKASVACLIAIFKEVADKVDYPLGLQIVTDEETGGFHGTKHQIDNGVRADFVIVGEPTNFEVVYMTKGVLHIKTSTKGKTAHGAYPWEGENAIWKMNEFLNALKIKYPVPTQEEWITTINVSMIETDNRAFNKIPDYCAVSLDIRYIPEEENTILESIRALIPDGFELDIVAKEPGAYVNKDNVYIENLQKVAGEIIQNQIILRGANGSSDARHFARVSCPSVEFGPLGKDIGGDDEWVSISSLGKYYEILTLFLSSL